MLFTASAPASAPASAITSTIGLLIWFHIRAVAIGFVMARIAPTAASILVPLRCLATLARPGFLRVEWVALIYWNILTNHLLDTTQILAFVLITESNGDAPLACAARASNAVHIDLGLVR